MSKKSAPFPITSRHHLQGLMAWGTLCKKATIHQVTTMLATSKNVLFPSHNRLPTTGADDRTLWLSPEHQQGEGSSVPVVSRWLWPGNRTFSEVANMVVTWWIVAFFLPVVLSDVVAKCQISACVLSHSLLPSPCPHHSWVKAFPFENPRYLHQGGCFR